jgi:hypothetical protein
MGCVCHHHQRHPEKPGPCPGGTRVLYGGNRRGEVPHLPKACQAVQTMAIYLLGLSFHVLPLQGPVVESSESALGKQGMVVPACNPSY